MVEHQALMAEVDDHATVTETKEMSSIESKFRERYGLLKKIYEDRIKNLTKRVQELQIVLENDPVLDKMKSDPTTRPFVPARSQEIIVEALASEREEQIETLADELSHVSSENSHLAHMNSQLQRQVQGLRKKLAEVTKERDQVITASEKQISELEERWSLAKAERLKEHEALRAAVRRLSVSLARNLRKGRRKNRGNHGHDDDDDDDMDADEFYYEYNDVVERHEDFMMHGDSGGMEGSKMMLERFVQLEQRLMRQNSSREKEIRQLQEKLQGATNQLTETQNALARSEEERLELRDQYMAIGQKLERVVSTTDEHQRKESIALREKLREAETRVQHLTTLNERMQSDLNQATMRLERKDARVQDLETRMQQMVKQVTAQEQSTALMHKQQLEAEQSRYKLLLDRFEETKREDTDKIQAAQKDASKAFALAQADREKWEKTRETQLREFQQKLESQFQKLLDAKQAELDLATKTRQNDLQRQQSETERVEKVVAERLQRALKDHISLEQHREILAEQLASVQAHGVQSETFFKEQTIAEQRYAVRDAEEKARAQSQILLEAATQESSTLRGRLEQAKREQVELERALEEDRRRMLNYQRQAEQGASRQKALEQSLQQALGNLNRLKKIVRSEQEKRVAAESAAESATKASKEALQDEISYLKTELEETRQRCTHLEREIAFSDTKLAESTHKVKVETDNKIADLKLEKEKAVREVENSRKSEIERLETSHKHELEMLQIKSEAMDKENKATIKDLTSQVEAAQILATEFKSKFHDASENLHELQSLKKSLETELEREKAALKKHQTELGMERDKSTRLKQRQVRESNQRRQLANNAFSLRRSFASMSNEIKMQLESANHEYSGMIHRIKDAIKQQQRDHSKALVAQATELDNIHQRRVDSLQTELNYVQEKYREATNRTDELLTTKEHEELENRNKLVEATSTIKELEGKLKDLQAQLETSKEATQHMKEELERSQGSERQLSQTLTQQKEQISELERQLDLRNTNFLSVLASIRSKIPFPQQTLDHMINSENFATSGLYEFNQALDDALSGISAKVKTEAVAPLHAQLEEKLLLQEKLDKFMERTQKIEGENTRLMEKLANVQRELALAEQKVSSENSNNVERSKKVHELEIKIREEKATFQAEKSALQQQHQRVMDSLKHQHQQAMESVKTEARRTEEQLKMKLEREKEKNRRMREDMTSERDAVHSIAIPSPSTPRNVRGSSYSASGSSIGGGRPTSPFYQAMQAYQAQDLSDFQKLMQRSAMLDSAAHQLISEVQKQRPLSSSRPRTASSHVSSASNNSHFKIKIDTSKKGSLKGIHISSPGNNNKNNSSEPLSRSDL